MLAVDVVLAFGVVVRWPSRGREWSAGSYSVPLDMAAGASRHRRRGRRGVQTLSLSATRTQAYQRGRKKKRKGGGALEEGEGNLGKEEGSLRLILPRGRCLSHRIEAMENRWRRWSRTQ